MSVWFKYAGDKDITPGHPGGSSIFAPPGAGSGFPPYGTVLGTLYGYDYQVGATTYSSILATLVYTQTCDVDVVADGVGGYFIDWAGAINIAYKPYNTFIAWSGVDLYANPVEVPTDSGNFINSGYYDDFNEVHNGFGGTALIGQGPFYYYAAGTYTNVSNFVASQTEVPSSSGQYWDNGNGYSYPYLWDGSGGYYESSSGTPYGSPYESGTEISSGIRYVNSYYQTEVPTGSSHFENNGKTELYTYYWDGSGSYYSGYITDGGSYYDYNVYIYNDGTYDYYWDGYGGYFTI